MFSGDWIAKRRVLFRSGSLDGGPDLFNFGLGHFLEIDRILFGTGQDDGLNEAGIDWHGFRPEYHVDWLVGALERALGAT
jgi:hypothetical protein